MLHESHVKQKNIIRAIFYWNYLTYGPITSFFFNFFRRVCIYWFLHCEFRHSSFKDISKNVSFYHFVRKFLYFYHFLNRHFGTWKVIPRVTLRFWVKNGKKRYPHRVHHGLNKKTGPSRRRRGNSPFRATPSTHPLYHDITFLRQ